MIDSPLDLYFCCSSCFLSTYAFFFSCCCHLSTTLILFLSSSCFSAPACCIRGFHLLSFDVACVLFTSPDMASSYVGGATEKSNSSGFTKTMKRTLSSGSSSCSEGAAVPRCVCAPATHARSFKCRLHRVNSNGHSHQSPPLPRQTPAADGPSTRTVEAQ